MPKKLVVIQLWSLWLQSHVWLWRFVTSLYSLIAKCYKCSGVIHWYAHHNKFIAGNCGDSVICLHRALILISALNFKYISLHSGLLELISKDVQWVINNALVQSSVRKCSPLQKGRFFVTSSKYIFYITYFLPLIFCLSCCSIFIKKVHMTSEC